MGRWAHFREEICGHLKAHGPWPNLTLEGGLYVAPFARVCGTFIIMPAPACFKKIRFKRVYCFFLKKYIIEKYFYRVLFLCIFEL